MTILTLFCCSSVSLHSLPMPLEYMCEEIHYPRKNIYLKHFVLMSLSMVFENDATETFGSLMETDLDLSPRGIWSNTPEFVRFVTLKTYKNPIHRITPQKM